MLLGIEACWHTLVKLAYLGFQSDLDLSMHFDTRLRPAYSLARVNRALVTNGRIGCVGLSHNESYSDQTMVVIVVNVC